jgi:hypothetical protein
MSDKQTECQVCKVDERLGLVFGFAVVSKIFNPETETLDPYFDTQGDHIPEDALLKASLEFAQDSRLAMEMHGQTGNTDPIGSVVFIFPMLEDIAKSMGILTPMTGLLIAMRPNEEILAKFASGEFTGFSIGGSRIVDQEV